MKGPLVAESSNGKAMKTAAVPVLDAGELHDVLVSSVAAGARVVALFGHQSDSGLTRLFAVLAFDANHVLQILSADEKQLYPSLTPECPQAHLFEREIYEQFGIRPEGHPWLKPVRFHPTVENRKTQCGSKAVSAGDYEFFGLHGDEVHEVAVGPVHAGVIEPGHFRFQCHGEVVYHLEIQLGYQRRGVEEALVAGPHPRSMLQIEATSGDTTIGHATAYCQAVEALSGTAAPPEAQALRALSLELERLANHVGDIGALANDVGFLPTASYCGRLRGDFLNMTALICGSRFGRAMVRPGGVQFDVEPDLAKSLIDRLDRAEADLKGAVDLFFETESCRSRMEGCGVLSAQACSDLGMVGIAARASGIQRDCRTDQPAGWYRGRDVPLAVCAGGDVLARASVRRKEVEYSLGIVRQLLCSLPQGPIMQIAGPLDPDALVVSMVEGWRGEVVHVAITDSRGKISRYKVVDPSFRNWIGLAMALRGGQISDFPLCNKSFNLSYCGFDL